LEEHLKISAEHIEELKVAKEKLTNLIFAIEVMNYLGKPIDKGIKLLPVRTQDIINKAVSKTLKKSIEIVNITIPRKGGFLSSAGLNRAAVIASGGVGGFFGIAGLPIELPISTGIMLRSIISIAKNNGVDINSAQGKLSCIEVLALGGGNNTNQAENSYYAIRAVLAKAFEDAAKYIASKGLIEEGAPPIVKFMAQISSRFGITVTDKIAVEAVPIIGAATGAVINLIFINHFIRMAEGHFTIRRLEAIYGFEVVRDQYNLLD
jgi:hypothetical protein